MTNYHYHAAVSRKITAVLPNLWGNGAVGMMLRLLEGLQSRGHIIQLVLTNSDGEHSYTVPRNITVHEFRFTRASHAILPLARLFRLIRPDVVLAAEHYSGLPALYARTLARIDARCIIRLDNTWGMIEQTFRGRHKLLTPWMVGRLFAGADIVAVSRGVATDFVQRFPHLRKNLTVIYNPVITNEIVEQADVPTGNPWYEPGHVPIVVAVGRLVRQKGFDILIDAFSIVARTINAKLVIVGEGPERKSLKALIAKNGLEQVCELVGHRDNPYPYMRGADVFVLSSRYEGLPTVLIEALALGVPAIATDCPSGPSEILASGKYGALLPVNDPVALAGAISAQLSSRRATTSGVQDWLQPFTAPASISAHNALIDAALQAPKPRNRVAPLLVDGSQRFDPDNDHRTSWQDHSA